MTIDTSNHYYVLGVPRCATTDEIRAAYRARVRACHPDLHPELGERATREMVKVNEAMRVLGDVERRREYDARLWAKRHPLPPPDPDPIWHRSAKGNWTTVYEGRRATVFQYRRGPNTGQWTFVLDDVFDDEAYPTEHRARAYASAVLVNHLHRRRAG